ncbi:MAG: CPBP family intramembrane glutamic endopeptidase [Eubacteriaceae bacterium]
MKKKPLILALVALVVGEIGVSIFHRGLALWVVLLSRLILALMMLFIIGFFAGKTTIRWKMDVVSISLLKSRYALVLGFLIGLGALPSVGSLVLALFVGVFEESLFRGILFDSLLLRLGETRKGIIQAAILSSFIFGFSHVYLDFFKGNAITVNFVLLALLKTVETGMFGFFLAALYLKTESIWGISLIHGLFYSFSIEPSLLIGTGLSAIYTGTNGSNMLLTIVYLVTIILSIPLVVKGNRMIQEVALPQRGVF